MDSTKKLPTWGRGVNNPEKLPTSFMDGPLAGVIKLKEMYKEMYVVASI